MRTSLFLAIVLLVVAPFAPAQKVTLPLWPNGAPEPSQVNAPEADITKPSDRLVAGKRLMHLTNVSKPTLAVYPPADSVNTGAAVVVFPGGGYRILAYDLEGTEVCTWLNSIGVTCVLVKYRVPFAKHYPENAADLEDAQQAMRITRSHAAAWHIDPNRIGVLGFSAGAHLAVVLSNHADYKRPGEPEQKIDARPNFALIIYPGYLAEPPALNKLAAGIDPTSKTPPTFLLQAEDDPVHEENALVYFQALKEAKVPAELHIYAEGGHGYGLRPTELPITHWPALAETWLHTIHILGASSTAKP
ncbi:MAG: xylanase [Acidobacteriales bacterium 59-55]|nr:MAG: xylanase [Acidobacteriales bacterium 59-55]